MKTKEVTPILKSLGWKAFTDEVGDKYTHYELPDRIVQIIYGVCKTTDHQKFESTISLSTGNFSKACASICEDDENYSPLIRAWTGIHIRASEILEEHVIQASKEAIAWAKEQDLDKALQDHAALPTNAPGARPIWHLAALALLGDVAKLKSYQASFEAGDRLGFVNYVTKDFIDRAVALADAAD
jgi:hypothetical protein